MDAPKCRLCEKRHYGSCSDSVVPAEPRARRSGLTGGRKTVGPKKKLKADNSNIAKVIDHHIHEELLARVESLEDRLGRIDKRREYQRDLMRARRLKEKGG